MHSKKKLKDWKTHKDIQKKLEIIPDWSTATLLGMPMWAPQLCDQYSEMVYRWSPMKQPKHQLFSDATKRKKPKRAKLLMRKLFDVEQPKFLCLDEKFFTVQEINKFQNDQIWTKNKESDPIEPRRSFRSQKPALVMVWTEVVSSGLKRPWFPLKVV